MIFLDFILRKTIGEKWLRVCGKFLLTNADKLLTNLLPGRLHMTCIIEEIEIDERRIFILTFMAGNLHMVKRIILMNFFDFIWRKTTGKKWFRVSVGSFCLQMLTNADKC